MTSDVSFFLILCQRVQIEPFDRSIDFEAMIDPINIFTMSSLMHILPGPWVNALVAHEQMQAPKPILMHSVPSTRKDPCASLSTSL